VAVLATASAPEGEVVFGRWNEMAMAHYGSLGVPAQVVPVRNRQDAGMARHADVVRAASMIFFSGGNPRHLRQALVGTELLEAIRQLLERGGVYAGCSAGAMIAGDPLPAVDGLVGRAFGHGLGLVQDHVFGVHWDSALMRPWRNLLAARVPSDKHLLGISERTAVVGGRRGWSVSGRGSVEHRFRGRREFVQPGEAFSD
jgi:cyanophycinase